jgi:hypothetical protein
LCHGGGLPIVFYSLKGGVQYKGGVNDMFCSDINIFVAKKCLVALSADLALLMLVFILVSSLSSVLIMVLRYLKL